MNVTALCPLQEAEVWTLENRAVRVSVERATGLIRAAVFKKNRIDLFQQTRSCVAGQAGVLRVYDERDDVWYEDLRSAFRVTDGRQRGNVVSFTKQYAGAPFTLRVRLTMEGNFLRWEVEARKLRPSVADRSLRVSFGMPLIAGWKLWAPCALGERTFDGMTPFEHCHLQVSYVSEQEVILPMVSHFDGALDVGYSVLEPIDAQVPAAKFAFNNADRGFTWRHQSGLAAAPTLETINAFIGLTGNRPLRTQVMLLFHEGHWRPALGEVFRRWKPFFVPPNPHFYDLEGMFTCAGVHSGYRPAAEWKRLGCKLLEAHGHFSYYGDYHLAGRARWPDMSIFESIWRVAKQRGQPMTETEVQRFAATRTPEEILDFLGLLKDHVSYRLSFPDGRPPGAKLTPAQVAARVYTSRAFVRRTIRELTDAGVHPFWYFNYSDGFRPVMEAQWRSSICKQENGQYMPSGWMMCHNMNCDPKRPFGRFLIASARRIVREHPKLAGFFLDCFRHFEVDFAHDDGVTVVNNRRAYSVNFSYDAIERIFGPLRVRHNLCSFANKPQTVRTMRWVDGMMIEGDGDQAEMKYFWSCLAKPIIYLWTTDRAGDDQNCRRAVLYGCFPKVASDPEGVARRQRYLPLYEQFRRRVFCFEPDPLRVPAGCRGELYTVGGDYVAGIANVTAPDDMEVRYRRTPYAMFRVARGHDVGRVGVLLPGMRRFRFVPFQFNGAFVAVPLEGFSNAAVVKLFVTRDTGRTIDGRKFQGAIDSCGDPDSSFTDLHEL